MFLLHTYNYINIDVMSKDPSGLLNGKNPGLNRAKMHWGAQKTAAVESNSNQQM